MLDAARKYLELPRRGYWPDANEHIRRLIEECDRLEADNAKLREALSDTMPPVPHIRSINFDGRWEKYCGDMIEWRQKQVKIWLKVTDDRN